MQKNKSLIAAYHLAKTCILYFLPPVDYTLDWS